MLAEEGFGCQAFCGTRSDTPDEGPIQNPWRWLGVNYEIRRAKIGPYEGRLLFVADGRVGVTLIENASTPGRLKYAEAQTFLTACDIFLRANRPDVVWTYGGDPVSLAVHVLARRLDIPVVFSMHDFGFTDGEASAERWEPWVQTIIRLWDDAAQYGVAAGRRGSAAKRRARPASANLPRVLRRHHPSARTRYTAAVTGRATSCKRRSRFVAGCFKASRTTRALHRLGVIRHQQGDQEAAIELIGRAIALDPQNALYRNDYGLPLVSLRRFGGGPGRFPAALKIDPQNAQALANLGALLIVTDRADLAVGALREAMAASPDRAKAHLDLGVAYTALGHDEAALASIRRVLDLQPRHLNALMRCARADETRREDEAVPFYERAMAERPSAKTHIDFGNLLFGLGQRPGHRPIPRGRRVAPELAEAHFNVGIMLKDQGKIEEAATHYRRAVELKPDSAMMHGNLLLCEQYRADATPAGLAAAHAEWDRRHAASLRARLAPLQPRRRDGTRVAHGVRLLQLPPASGRVAHHTSH